MDQPRQTSPADALAALREQPSPGHPPIDVRQLVAGWLVRVGPARAAMVVVTMVAAALGLWWLVVSSSSGSGQGLVAAPSTVVPFQSPAGPGPTSTAPADIVVHAAGAVERPGVYRLDASARVGDLLHAAGGATAEADVDRLNLAAPLADGGRVYVPRRGEPDPAAPLDVDLGGTPGAGAGAGTPSGRGGKLDLNTATAAQLEELPGIGPATAAAIIEHRERNGPFRSVESLLDVRGIGPAKLEQVRDALRV